MRIMIALAVGGWLLLSSCAKELSPYAVEPGNRKEMKLDTRMKTDRSRIARENHKQRKKIYRESRRANRKRNYDTNELGNVFKGL